MRQCHLQGRVELKFLLQLLVQLQHLIRVKEKKTKRTLESTLMQGPLECVAELVE